MLRRGTPNISNYLIDDICGFLVNKWTKPLLGDLNLAKIVISAKGLQMDGRRDGRTEGRKDWQTDRWMEGRMDRQTDGRLDASKKADKHHDNFCPVNVPFPYLLQNR